MNNSIAAELSRIADTLKKTAAWPSPATGLGFHLLGLCDCEGRRTELLGIPKFPHGALDAAPAAAAAGFAIVESAPRPEELERWRAGTMRLLKREPFPRDRQTFAYRPTELVGLALGILKTESRSGSSAASIRSIIQELPKKTPPTTPWALLLYHYAAAIVGDTFPIYAPARVSEYGSAELGLLVALLDHGTIGALSDFEAGNVQGALLERALTESSTARDTGQLAALFGGLSLSVKAQISTLRLRTPTSPSNDPMLSHPSKVIMKQKILFLTANPAGTEKLDLDQECREITTKIRASEHRDSLELISRWAVQPEDLLQHLNEHHPHVVHFSGHGTPTDEIVLLDNSGDPKPVSGAALKQLFTTLKDNISVVILNACYSKHQAEAITEVIDCAIGMNKEIGDAAAIKFAAAFYQGIGFGRSVKTAFESGKSILMLDGIPEENTPELICRSGIDPDTLVLVKGNPEQPNPR